MYVQKFFSMYRTFARTNNYDLTVFGPEVKTGPVRSGLPVRIGLGTDLDLFDPVLPVRIGL